MTDPFIRRTLAEILGQDDRQITPGMRLWHWMDAVSLAKLIIACERHYKVTIHDEHVPGFLRLDDLARYVEERAEEGRDDYQLPDDDARTAWYYE